MVKSDQRYQRLGIRYSKVFVFFAGFGCVAILLALVIRQLLPASPFRTNILLVGNPMLLASYDTAKEHVAIVEIPAVTTITGITGVGEYSLESLWRLGKLDTHNQNILPDSLSEALAVPVTWFVGPKGDAVPDQSEAEKVLRNVFSFSGLVQHVFTSRTTIPFGQYLMLVIATTKLRPDALSFINLHNTSAIITKDQADGTSVPMLDEARLDVVLGTTLQEDALRRESLRVAIFNTTRTPTLGRRLERHINKVGALVVSVGNDVPAVDRCALAGTALLLKSITARYIQSIFGCEVKITDANARADLELRIGNVFERKFFPL